MTVRTLACQVRSVEDLTSDVFRVILEGRAEAIVHAPGQYLELAVDDDTWVPFSIASAESGDGRLELHIQHWPERRHSARLRELLTHQARLSVRLPNGACYLPAAGTAPLMLVGAGTGFAQMKAIVEAALGENAEREIELWWAVRERRDLYAESLACQWALEHANVVFHAIVESSEAELEPREGVEWHRGRIDTVLAAEVEALEDREIYFSGSPGMVYACVDTLAPKGLSETQCHSDVFDYAPRVPFLPLPDTSPKREALAPGEAMTLAESDVKGDTDHRSSRRRNES